MTREEAQQFKVRWKLVNEFTARETRDASPSLKLHQLALMYEAGRVLGWADALRKGEEDVRARWRRLKEMQDV